MQQGLNAVGHITVYLWGYPCWGQPDTYVLHMMDPPNPHSFVVSGDLCAFSALEGCLPFYAIQSLESRAQLCQETGLL